MPLGREFGGVIFDNTNESGDIVLSEVDKNTSLTTGDGSFRYNEIAPEIIANAFGTYNEQGEIISSPKYNCVVYYHTHPYRFNSNATESSRFFSSSDIDFYKEKETQFAKANKTLKTNAKVFGCVLTMSKSNEAEKDDIQFVWLDLTSGEMMYYPNVYIKKQRFRKIVSIKNSSRKSFL